MHTVEAQLRCHLTESALADTLAAAALRLGAGGCAMLFDCLEMHDYDPEARHAFVDGWATSMWVGAAAVAALLIYLVVRGAPQPAPMSAPAS